MVVGARAQAVDAGEAGTILRGIPARARNGGPPFIIQQRGDPAPS